MFRNPFKTTLAIGAYAPVPAAIDASHDQYVHANAVDLDDANYPDVTGPGPLRGMTGDLLPAATQPAYAGTDESRQLVDVPGPAATYAFLPHDQTVPQDIGSVPGTDRLNIHHGPVTGFAMDAYQEGNRVPLHSQPVGLYGPVGNTEPDYATRAAYANFQSAFADVSTAASIQSNVAVI